MKTVTTAPDRREAVIDMLSTIRRIAWETVDGEVIGEIVRVRGRCVLKGMRPRGRTHYHVIEYNDGRGVDRSLIV